MLEDAMDKLRKLHAQLEGGRVRRCHTSDIVGHYDNAQHSFNMALIYLACHPSPQPDTVVSILYHDLSERYTGDIPAPALLADKELHEAMDSLESRIRYKMGAHLHISEEEWWWMKSCDKVEHWLWAHRQVRMGNIQVANHIVKLEEIFEDLEMPLELKFLVDNYDHTRGSDEIPS